MTHPTPWLLANEAAKYARMNEDTIRNLFRRRDIKAVKTGKNWRTKPEWIDAYLMGGTAA